MKRAIVALTMLAALAVSVNNAPPLPAGVTDAMLASPPPGEWLSYGRDHAEQRFSPLTQLNDGNVGQLGLAWYADIDTARGQEATPLMHDGLLYVSTAWSMVKAYDARTGALRWSYDPRVPRDTLARACCDAVNRGVALYGDKLFVGTLDGRLVALDQRSGRVVWSKLAVPAQADYTITGAPRVAHGKVFIGSGGAEYKARGSIAAFDAQTGRQLWRFHTVPGNPARGFENKAMAAAARSWSGNWWKLGGGGTVWDAITYDPATNLVLFGTGNAEPWNPAVAGNSGDRLYTSSIVAVNADTGQYAWHYQETPEDRWDFDSTAQITVADLTVDGRQRHVALHAPKNGFFYMFDARTGDLISAGSIAPQNWTKGIDPKTGKAMVNPEARYEQTGRLFMGEPGGGGSHSWQPMSFSPKTGLVYIPAAFAAYPYLADKHWNETGMGYQTGADFAVLEMLGQKAAAGQAMPEPLGLIIAWDPVAQKEAWRVPHAAPMNGGILSTAGNLLFQGTAEGTFNAYSADKGAKLWSFPAQAGIAAAPMSYAIGGEQYVAVLAGFGGLSPRRSRLLVFRLKGMASLPALPAPEEQVALDPPPFTGTPAQVEQGHWQYGRYCLVCHIGMYNTPMLRQSPIIADPQAFRSVVIDGAFRHKGMASFRAALQPDQAEAIRQYLIKSANDARAAGGRQ